MLNLKLFSSCKQVETYWVISGEVSIGDMAYDGYDPIIFLISGSLLLRIMIFVVVLDRDRSFRWSRIKRRSSVLHSSIASTRMKVLAKVVRRSFARVKSRVEDVAFDSPLSFIDATACGKRFGSAASNWDTIELATARQLRFVASLLYCWVSYFDSELRC